ncbi:MAG: hypothetical protein ABFR33_03025 [Verrucomicrobiota bacterium]
MKNRKSMVCFVAALVVCSAVFSNAARKNEITLVMVPREDATVQLGMDIANKYPTLLISYKLGANKTVSLHGWTGSEWVNVTLESFQGGKFFKKGPDTALVVEKAGIAVPGKMLPSPDWCDSAVMITTTEERPLLHLVGRYYDFSFKEWKWFAKRYKTDMDAINPEGLNVAWYHRRGGEHLVSRGQQGESDLRYWVSIYRKEEVQPVAPQPVVPADTQTEEAVAVPMEEAEEPGNPLTNDAPAAVIMGADETAVKDTAPENPAEPAPVEETAVEEKVPESSDAPAPADEAAVEEKTPEDPEAPAPVDEATVEEEATEISGEM